MMPAWLRTLPCKHSACCHRVSCPYRLCLTYNLRLAGTPSLNTLTLKPDLVAHLARLCELWEADPEGPPFLVYMLEHR